MIDLNEKDDSSTSLQDPMTPMIDVIFVLVAFMMLMINAPLMTMEVELPKSVEKPQFANLERNIVTIGVPLNENVWQVNDTKVETIAKLKKVLAEQKTNHSDISIVIHSDKMVAMERIVQLFAALQALELKVSHLALKE